MQWSPCNTCVSTDGSLGFISDTPYNGLYGEALPERGTFFRLQVYERVENLSFGCVKGPKGLTDGFYGSIKSRKRSVFVMLSS